LSKPKNSERNRAIFAAHCSGETVGSLSEMYGLRPGTLYAVILAEKHRRAFSPLSVYQEARSHAADNPLTASTIE
jgi:Mor family transcriptional regulator